MMIEYTFYVIECNGKRYVGQTIDFDERIKGHRNKCFNVENCNIPLYQYIRENGNWNSCKISILEKCNFETKQDALMREEYWRIKKEASLNSLRCFVSKEQLKQEAVERAKLWMNKNKEKLKILRPKIDKTYREKNKDWMNKKKREKRKQERLKKKMLKELKIVLQQNQSH
jgi:hypothetical protein